MPDTRGMRFLLDGQVVETGPVAPTRTLLEYLREDLGRCGTKEGCAEGDCGACTVVLGECGADGRMGYRAVNACIRFLPSVNGREVITAESLRAPDGRLHPVQQALLDCHGSQCGFCTPGFVMSLFDLYLKDGSPAREGVVDALAGNLCRCTGYRPIIEAGCRMKDYPEPAHWGRGMAQDPAHALQLGAVAPASGVTETVPGFHAPRSLVELSALYLANPGWLLLAGGTDIGLWVTKQLRELPPLIHLGEVPELKTLRETDCLLEVGAAVPLTEAFAALVRHYPMLGELARRFASPPIRNSGTLCGNIANGSPIGDAMPILIALGASVVLRRGADERVIPLEALYLGYQKKDLQPGEFVRAVRIPLCKPCRHTVVASYKLSKRIDQDISAVCVGICMEVRDGAIADVRLGYGGMAATPRRALKTEAALIGQPWTEAAILAALPALAADFQPLTDMRASSAYRLQTAGALLVRFYREHADPDDQALGDVQPVAVEGGA